MTTFICMVLVSAWVGKHLALRVLKHRPIFTYQCKDCGEYITIIDAGILSRPCASCGKITDRIYNEEASNVHARGQKKLEIKMQAIAAITAGTITGFLYGFFF